MNFPFWVARRYAFSFRSFHFITFISLLSSIGICIGVAALIIITAVFSGFRDFAFNEIISIDPHIRILPKSGNYFDARTFNFIWFSNKLAKYYPFVSAKVIVNKDGNLRVAKLFGLPDTILAIGKINQKVNYGHAFVPVNNSWDATQSLVGVTFADALNLLPERHFFVYPLTAIDTAITFGKLPKGAMLRATGIFATNNSEYDDQFIFVDIATARKILSLKDSFISGVDVRVSDYKTIPRFKTELEKQFTDYQVLSWFDLNRSIMNAMEFERYAVFIILSLIIVIAVFNVLASLFMTVVEKRADIAVLKSFGATTKQIQKIFTLQGLILGTLSTFVGLILGLGFCIGQINFQWLKLNAQKYVITALPMKIEPLTVLAIILVSLVISYFATIIPSKRSIEVNIADAIFRE
ncbi:MAG: ABC transporter permease [Candidatus Kapaibacteriales bacterium]